MTYSRDQLAIWYWSMEQKEKHRQAMDVLEGIRKLVYAVRLSSEKKFLRDLLIFLEEWGIRPQDSPFYSSYDEDDGKYVLSGKVKALEKIRLECDIDENNF